MAERNIRNRNYALHLLGAAALAVFVLTASIFVLQGSAQAQTARTVQEIYVIGRGTGILNMPIIDSPSPVSADVNGTAGTVVFSPARSVNNNDPSDPAQIPPTRPAEFSMQRVVLQGDPGTVTIVYTIDHPASYDQNGNYQDGDGTLQTITFTINTSSGAITVDGTDSGGGATHFGNNVTLTADTSNTTVGVNGSSFTVSGTGDFTDNVVQACVTLSSGMRICANTYIVYEPIDNSQTQAERDAIDAARDQQGEDNYVGAIQMFTAHMTDVMVYQMPIIGIMLDAKHQLETERIYGNIAAQAHHEYQPSEQVCAFGTLARSTAPSKFRVDDNISIINLMLQKRETLNANLSSSWGPGTDMNARLDKYKSVYCDRHDNAGEIGLSDICTAPALSNRLNKDIDWRRTIEANMTLDIDFTSATGPNNEATADEQDVIALAQNLYASNVLTQIPETSIAPNGSFRELQDARMLTAIRSVSRHSFASIVAAKSRGSGLNAQQLRQVMQNLGVPAADVTALIGANPSYFTQMDFISQKMYQDQAFFSGLYTSPTNVARMKVVLQAIRLMADRDRFEESLRREMLVSMLLEMRLRQAEETVKNKVSKSKVNR